MTWAFASAIGPLLGGILTTRASWKWCFFINLPCTAVSALVILFKLKVHTPKIKFREGIKRIDWVGSFLMITGAVLLLLGLQMGGVEHSWASPIILSFLICGVFLLVIFALVEFKAAKYPLIPVRVLSNRTSISALGVCCFHRVLGATPLMSGIYLLPLTLSLSISNCTAGLVVRSTGKYLVVMRLATCIMTLGFGLFINLSQDYRWAKIIIYQIVAGIGIGPNFQCPILAVQASSSQADHAAAASTFNFLNNLSASITIVISTAIFQNTMQSQQAMLISEVGSSVAELLTGHSAVANVEVIGALPERARTIAQNAFLKAMLDMWIMYVVLGSLSILCSLCVQDKVLSKEHKVTETGIEAEDVKRGLEEERRKSKREMRDSKC
ncbi:hypothetical protein ACMFMG_001198 [Clarireedia jacksonii]